MQEQLVALIYKYTPRMARLLVTDSVDIFHNSSGNLRKSIDKHDRRRYNIIGDRVVTNHIPRFLGRVGVFRAERVIL